MNEQPPALKAQFIIWATGSGHQSSFQNGAWTQDLLERWLEGSGFPETIQQVKEQEVYSDWWDTVEIGNKFGRCYFPSVFWGGSYDIFLRVRAARAQRTQFHWPHTQTHESAVKTILWDFFLL